MRLCLYLKRKCNHRRQLCSRKNTHTLTGELKNDNIGVPLIKIENKNVRAVTYDSEAHKGYNLTCFPFHCV